jgi:DNA gyrase/topoisomerase IV subunit A
MPVCKIPLVDKNGAGTDVRILNRTMTADIIAAYYEPTIQKVIDSGRKHYFVVATKNNTIKKLDMEDFLNVSVSGLKYSSIKDTDEVVGIALAPADLDIVIFSKQKALRTSVKNIPLLKRNATGSKAMATKNDIEGLSVLYPDEDYVAVVTEKGKINKFQMSALSPHARGCAGINVIKLKDHDSIKSIYGASDRDTLRIITSNQTIEVPVADIQSRSPVAAGDNIPLKGASIIRVDLMYQQK